MTKTLAAAALALAALEFAANAHADSTLDYRSEGGCAGDFDRVQVKAGWLRVDSDERGENAGSMIYDHTEKLGYFIDHRERSFMQTEMDEDATDLQADIMKSLRIRMRRETGIDPFAMAKALCPGLAGASGRDRLPDEPLDCGNGMSVSGTPAGADGKPMSRDEEMEAAIRSGHLPLDADSQRMVQNLIEQQLANLPPEQRAEMQRMLAGRGGASLMTGAPPAKAPPQRIDHDAGEIEVGGITCLRRQHLRDGEILREDCYAPVAALRLGDVETRRIARFSKAMQAWSRSLMPDDPPDQADDRVLVRRVCYAAGHESGRATLAIDHAPIADSRFEVPSGYKPMDLGFGRSARRDDD